ncbi:hypothetical protein [Ginsengibacter hankyongi]|nr:hypothetical protein [Ginsengibacter hankyongi]
MKNNKKCRYVSANLCMDGVAVNTCLFQFYRPVILILKAGILSLIFMFLCPKTFSQKKNNKPEMVNNSGQSVGGYMIVQTKKVDQKFNAGYSIYTAAWPLLKEYPGRSFQSGLFGTWMFPMRDSSKTKEKLYSDIEGGLGWWRSTQYATTTPKFNMGGVQLNFAGWANGPGSGKGTDWNKPEGKYGVAQLSPWLLFPPDGLNLKQGTCGELFGYGYLPLPLTEAKSTTAGENIPTGNQSWTLFLNTGNFKGPVAFFTPYFWSQVALKNPGVSGLFLDVLPSNANKYYEMETQYVPSAEGTDAKGEKYMRIASIQYPAAPDGNSRVMNRLMVYNKKALWDGVKAWFDGGKPVSGLIDTSEGFMQHFTGKVRSTWQLFEDNVPKNHRALLNINTFLSADSADPITLTLNWNSNLVTRRKIASGYLLTLPEYYHFVKNNNDSIGEWVAVAPSDVPTETGLQKVYFKNSDTAPPRLYATPDDKNSCWKNPGPVAGPYKVKLGDGSTLTYYWYRFADQPALLNADLTSAEREEMQGRVEKLQRSWTKDKEYLPPPTIGKLADIDPALIVTPPAGLEVGYVPIVSRQDIE